MDDELPPFQAQRIDHVVLRVASLDRSVAFYRRLVGATVERERPDRGLVHLRVGASLIDLVSVDGPIGRLGGAGAGAEGRNMDHVCLRIEPFVDAEVLAHLVRHQVPHSSVAKIQFGAAGAGPTVYFQDPDGNTVELKGRMP